MCSGPFSGAQDTPSRRRAQREGATWIGSVAKWRLKPIAPTQNPSPNKVPFGLGAGGWVLLGWTGLVLLCTAQNPARLVYGSAALVASLRGQHCHFATLPIISLTTILQTLYQWNEPPKGPFALESSGCNNQYYYELRR